MPIMGKGDKRTNKKILQGFHYYVSIDGDNQKNLVRQYNLQLMTRRTHVKGNLTQIDHLLLRAG